MDEITLSMAQAEEFLQTLKSRFEQHMTRHPNISWQKIEARLRSHPGKLRSLHMMERTGGEPDVFAYDETTGEVIFFDFSAETPLGRRNLCYDRAALDARKENKPASSAQDLAAEMGVTMLDEEEYRALQALGEFVITFAGNDGEHVKCMNIFSQQIAIHAFAGLIDGKT